MGTYTEAAKKLGAKGGKAGGPARAKVLTPAERSAIARKGALAKNRKQPRKRGKN